MVDLWGRWQCLNNLQVTTLNCTRIKEERGQQALFQQATIYIITTKKKSFTHLFIYLLLNYPVCGVKVLKLSVYISRDISMHQHKHKLRHPIHISSCITEDNVETNSNYNSKFVSELVNSSEFVSNCL